MIERGSRCIRATRLDLSDEKRAQRMLAESFEAAGLPFQRELRLAPGDIVDFLVDGIAVELKLRGTPKVAIYRQLRRYATYARVEAIVLASNLAMGLPAEIEGKPAYLVSLGRAWL